MKYVRFAAPALLALAGCHHAEKQPAPAMSQTQAGVLITAGRLVLPAVPGHPAAAYFTLVNQGSSPITLVGVKVEGAARAEMHETKGGQMGALAQVALATGQSVLFAPGGKHVMLFDLAPTLEPGATVEATFTSSDGKQITGPLAVEKPGEMGPGMNHDAMSHEGMAGMKM